MIFEGDYMKSTKSAVNGLLSSTSLLAISFAVMSASAYAQDTHSRPALLKKWSLQAAA